MPPGSYGAVGTTTMVCSGRATTATGTSRTGIEVSLAVSRADEFADGELLCVELDSFDTPSTPVPELGDRAWWVTTSRPQRGDPADLHRRGDDRHRRGVTRRQPRPGHDARPVRRARRSGAGEPRLGGAGILHKRAIGTTSPQAGSGVFGCRWWRVEWESWQQHRCSSSRVTRRSALLDAVRAEKSGSGCGRGADAEAGGRVLRSPRGRRGPRRPRWSSAAATPGYRSPEPGRHASRSSRSSSSPQRWG